MRSRSCILWGVGDPTRRPRYNRPAVNGGPHFFSEGPAVRPPSCGGRKHRGRTRPYARRPAAGESTGAGRGRTPAALRRAKAPGPDAAVRPPPCGGRNAANSGSPLNARGGAAGVPASVASNVRRLRPQGVPRSFVVRRVPVNIPSHSKQRTVRTDDSVIEPHLPPERGVLSLERCSTRALPVPYHLSKWYRGAIRLVKHEHAMDVLWHHDHCIKANALEVFRELPPDLFHDFSGQGQWTVWITSGPEPRAPFMHDKGHEVDPGL